MRHELNDYILEKTKDTALLEIKSICFKYLQDKKIFQILQMNK